MSTQRAGSVLHRQRIGGTRVIQFHPLQSWFETIPGPAELPSSLAHVLAPRDEAWREIVPGYETCVELTRLGLPFHAVREGMHEEEPQHAEIPSYLREGKSIILIQPHELMPRLMRLIVALRAAFFGPFQEESAYLFMTEGRGQPGMALHHDGEAHSVWLQLAGTRTVALGPQVPPGTELEPEPAAFGMAGPGWSTVQLTPGSLFFLQPRVLHKVVCHERSLALSLTWEPTPGDEVMAAWLKLAAGTSSGLFAGIAAAPDPVALSARIQRACHELAEGPGGWEDLGRRLYSERLTRWDLVAGKPVQDLPGLPRDAPASRPARGLLWARRPAVLDADVGGAATLFTGLESFPVARPESVPRELASMPCWKAAAWSGADPQLLETLLAEGILASTDLPLLIEPEDLDELSGWDFAAQHRYAPPGQS
jgi:hypothetical protein